MSTNTEHGKTPQTPLPPTDSQELKRLRDENKKLRKKARDIEREFNDYLLDQDDWHKRYLEVCRRLENCTHRHDLTIVKTRVIATIFKRLFHLHEELGNVTDDFEDAISIDRHFEVVEFDEKGEQCDFDFEMFRCFARDSLDLPIKPGHCRLITTDDDDKVVAYVGDLAAIKDMGYVIDANTEVVKTNVEVRK